jgi:hypothetical protein
MWSPIVNINDVHEDPDGNKFLCDFQHAHATAGTTFHTTLTFNLQARFNSAFSASSTAMSRRLPFSTAQLRLQQQHC